MGLVDYSDEDSSDESQSPKTLGEGLRKDFDGTLIPSGRKVEVKTVKITPGGKKFTQEQDLAVLAALANPPETPEPRPARAPLKRKLEINLAPEVQAKKVETELPSEAHIMTSDSAEEEVVHAIGGGRHQLSSLIRNAVDNKAALQAQFSREKQARQGRGKKYGF